jgi:endonuclease/exonuclease/phosphatase family metal-dependent hydrolase
MRRLVVAASLALTAAAGVTPAAAAGDGPGSLRVVNFNVLHGVICPAESDGCQLPDRMALLGRRLQEASCPEVVGLQEVSGRVYDQVEALPAIDECGYDLVLPRPKAIDQEVVLTTLDVKATKVVKLSGFRTASRVELASDLGPVVIVVTHQDGDPEPGEPGADATCKKRVCAKVCEPGSPFLACQTTVAADLAEKVGGTRATRILMGDFNVTPASARYQGLVDDGWTDTHLAAGNPECDATTGAGCTSGRSDDVVDDMKDPNARQSERIDFIFLKAPRRCDASFDPAPDGDGDGLGTGIWDDPVLDGPGGMAFVSDHSATSVDLTCEGSA